jgi:hypothetical protein
MASSDWKGHAARCASSKGRLPNLTLLTEPGVVAVSMIQTTVPMRILMAVGRFPQRD